MQSRARLAVAVAALLIGMLVASLATMPQAEAHGFIRYGFSFPVFGPRIYAPPPPPPVVYQPPPPPPVFVEPRVAFYAPPRINYYAPPRIDYYAAPAVYRYRRHAVRHIRHVRHRQCVCQCCR